LLPGVNLTFAWDETLPEVQICDDLRISQIMLNLIGNAVKCMRFTASAVMSLT
jgi:signal transduction histidine kinase